MPQKSEKEPRVDCRKLQGKYEIPLELILDSVSLGMADREIAQVTGLKLREVKQLRRELGGIGSTLDISHKKDICQDAKSTDGH
ncbi:MAG: hypothetical protein GX349_05560 [Firmicutes bacterium]|nr:hypothetical protein [Bacillota bacterium]